MTVTKKVQTTITAKQLLAAFKVFDAYDDQHDGTLNMETVVAAFTKFATNKLSREDAVELISQVAPQKDNGLFDYSQFVKIYFSN
jgi:Ca2+-binding EF-hand superfamily protein